MVVRSGVEIRLRVLGKFAFFVGDREVAVPGRKTRALLAFLACNAEKAQSRDRLIGLLWAERFEEQARQSLRHALTSLRAVMGADALIADHELVRLKESFPSDVAQFHAMLSRGDPSSLRRAMELYEDELLSGFMLRESGFADWLATERARLRELAIGGLERLSAVCPDPDEAIPIVRRILALDAYREQAHRQLLRALAASGQRNEALLHYRGLERQLREDLGVSPEPQTREAFEALRSDPAPTAPAPASTSTSADKPAIAVLPFDSLGDGAAGRLADGITEDIITDLARFRGLDVIARNSTAAYKGRSLDLRQVGQELKVAYVLVGTLQRRAGQIRVTAQLTDSSTGGTIWSDRWDRPDGDIFAVQTEVAEAVAATLGGMAGSAAIIREEMRKARRRPPTNLTAYDHYLLANEGRSRFTRESIFEGLAAATKAIAIDPCLGRAYVARAWLNFITSHYGVDYETAMRGMESDARQAVELDPHDAEARAVLAFYLGARGRFDECGAQIRAALQANPANSQVLVVASAVLAWSGWPLEAAELADKALRLLDPWMTAENLNCIKDAYFFARRFKDVIAVVSRIPSNARGLGARLLLTLSYALLGREEEARRARAELLAHYPSISAELLTNGGWIYVRAEEENLLLGGFRAAGLPLCASAADLAGLPNPRRLPECARSEKRSS
jgi:TolB-like protein